MQACKSGHSIFQNKAEKKRHLRLLLPLCMLSGSPASDCTPQHVMYTYFLWQLKSNVATPNNQHTTAITSGHFVPQSKAPCRIVHWYVWYNK